MTALALIKTETLPREVGSLKAQPLTGECEAEVLDFLAKRPIHTVVMAGLIRDNGLVSPLNRGEFYGCRNEAGHLRGVALIGHVTMIETEDDDALKAFALVAQNFQHAHAILGEKEKVARFWSYYAPAGQPMRLACRELLLEHRWPIEVHEPVALRQATLDDLEQVMPAHAQMAFEESGVNPLEKDPEGFRRRTARRIEQGRVWVCMDEGRLIFKADVVSDTPDVIYVEGVWVNPDERGKGYGLRCVSRLSRMLLASTKSVSFLANEQNQPALSLYRKSGCKLRGYYDTIYLQQ